ncbi:GTPase Der [Glycine soja]|nr:GTPase Der [Glycine soja]
MWDSWTLEAWLFIVAEIRGKFDQQHRLIFSPVTVDFTPITPLITMLPLPLWTLHHEVEDSCDLDVDKSKLPLQLAILGRPNVGKSTLLNALLQEDHVLVGPEAGLTRDSIRTQFEFQGRTIYLVDTAGWLQMQSTPGIMQSRKSLLQAHIIALVLDAEEIINARRSMKHAEVIIARWAVEEGRGLVVIVNKMNLPRGKHQSSSYEKVMEIVPQEIQTIIPQVKGIPVVFISALEGRGRTTVLNQVMSRHSWKGQAAQPKVKYFTQVKARPPTFVA